jgi:AraC family ethanolamine operon transcriptional activator
MYKQTDSISSMQADFESLAEYLDATAELGWDQEFRQLDRGSSPASIKGVSCGMTQLLSVEYGNLIHQRIAPPRDCFSFGLLASPQAPIKLGANEVHSESLMHFDRHDGLDAIVKPGFNAITLTFDRELFGCMAERHELPTPDDKLYFCTSSRTRHAVSTAEIRQLTQQILSLAEAPQSAPFLEEALGSTLPRLIHQTWHGGIEPRTSRKSNRARALSKALEYINHHVRDAISVERLCQESFASVSTLERAFKDRFGVPPKSYMMACKLAGVRRALLNRNDDRPITDIAFEWGFWHMSKFAGDYNTLFGQLPSETRLTIRRT